MTRVNIEAVAALIATARIVVPVGCALLGAGAARADLRLLDRGDALLRAAEHGAAASEATLWKVHWFYQQELRRAPDSYEALWRLARAQSALAQAASDGATKAERGRRRPSPVREL